MHDSLAGTTVLFISTRLVSRGTQKGGQDGSTVAISARDPEILGSTPKAGGRWFRLGGEMFRGFIAASIPPLEVKCCASNRIHVSSQGRQSCFGKSGR